MSPIIWAIIYLVVFFGSIYVWWNWYVLFPAWKQEMRREAKRVVERKIKEEEKRRTIEKLKDALYEAEREHV